MITLNEKQNECWIDYLTSTHDPTSEQELEQTVKARLEYHGTRTARCLLLAASLLLHSDLQVVRAARVYIQCQHKQAEVALIKAISGYDNELYNQNLNFKGKFETVTNKLHAAKTKAHEILWTSYDLNEEFTLRA